MWTPEDEKAIRQLGALAGLSILSIKFVLVFLLLVASAGTCIWWAFRSTNNSFEQATAIEFASATGFFAILMTLIPVALTVGHLVTQLSLIAIALACGGVGYYQTGVIQALLIEAAVGLMMIAALDFGLEVLLGKWVERGDNLVNVILDNPPATTLVTSDKD